MSTKTPHLHVPAGAGALAMDSANDAVNMVDIGESCVSELGAILRALVSLSAAHPLIRDLAQVGAYLADNHGNTLDCERSAMREKLAALKGASYVQ